MCVGVKPQCALTSEVADTDQEIHIVEGAGARFVVLAYARSRLRTRFLPQRSGAQSDKAPGSPPETCREPEVGSNCGSISYASGCARQSVA